MPGAKFAGPASLNRADTPPTQRIQALLLERERLLAELSDIQARGEHSKTVEDAWQLVTRWWGKSNWDGREKLLRSARWLLNLKHRTDEPKLTGFEYSHLHK